MGFIVSENGVKLNETKIDAIKYAPSPKNVKELQSFLGGINYYSRYIPKMAEITKPLYDLLKKDVEWKWGKVQVMAFRALKHHLISAPILTLYDPKQRLKLDCDASYYGLGAVLSHTYSDGSEKPIAYASRIMNSNEQNYSQVEKEGLAIMFGLKKFNQYLYGRHFELLTDCKALRKIFHPNTASSIVAVSRLTRWSLILQEYDYEIEYRPTSKHGNADMLSRLPLSDSKTHVSDIKNKGSKNVGNEQAIYNIQIGCLPVTDVEIRDETKKDPILIQVMKCICDNRWEKASTKKGHDLYPYYMRRNELFSVSGILLWGLRVIVPKSLEGHILKELHSEHPGIVRMKALSRVHVWFPGIDLKIEKLVKECKNCQEAANEPPRARPHPWQWPSGPMDRIHLDYFGPFLGQNCLLMVDSFSKWGDVDIVPRAGTRGVIKVLRSWFSRYGLPNQIVSDNGPQFVSKEFKSFCKRNGIVHITVPRYHQSSNGEAERFVQTVKKGLKRSQTKRVDFRENLENFMFAQRNTPSPVTGFAPSELFIGRRLKSRLDLIRPNNSLVKNEARHVRHHSSSRSAKNVGNRDRRFAKNDKVVVRNFFTMKSAKWVPGVVVRAVGSRCYDVDLGNRIVKVHIDHMISDHTDARNDLVSENDDLYMYLPSDDDADANGNGNESNGSDDKADHDENADDSNESDGDNDTLPVPARERYPVIRGNRVPPDDDTSSRNRRYPNRVRRPVQRYGYSPHYYKQ